MTLQLMELFQGSFLNFLYGFSSVSPFPFPLRLANISL